jgi:hypothetical protein
MRLWEVPHIRDVQRVVEPLLGGFTMLRIALLNPDGTQLDMFVDDLGAAKDLSFNQRATDLFRQFCRSKRHNHILPPSRRESRYLAGTAVLFEEQVLFD